MGKKKSKTGKQRQAKAKVKSLQSKKLQFHVPISKAGQLLPAQSSKSASLSSSTLDHSNLKQSKKDKGNIIIRMGSNSKHDTKRKSPLNTWKSEEDKAYEQEYLSLQERQYHAQINKMSSKKKKDISLTPASLQLKMDRPPTAEELIQDTAQKLDGIMSFSNTTITTTSSSSSSNSNHTLANHHNPQNLLQILAAQKRQEQYMISTTTQTNKNEENKFWVLQQDEDDDSEDEMTTRNDTSKTSNVPVFQFAAPSFSVPLANQPTNAVDDDPDL